MSLAMAVFEDRPARGKRRSPRSAAASRRQHSKEAAAMIEPTRTKADDYRFFRDRAMLGLLGTSALLALLIFGYFVEREERRQGRIAFEAELSTLAADLTEKNDAYADAVTVSERLKELQEPGEAYRRSEDDRRPVSERERLLMEHIYSAEQTRVEALKDAHDALNALSSLSSPDGRRGRGALTREQQLAADNVVSGTRRAKPPRHALGRRKFDPPLGDSYGFPSWEEIEELHLGAALLRRRARESRWGSATSMARAT